MSTRLAAIDIGTNSTNLLIVDGNNVDVVREVCVTRLGEGLYKSGSLSTTAINRTLNQLRHYRQLIDQHAVSNWRAVITAPGRLATNSSQFLDRAVEILGPNVEIASGEREALLSFKGAARGLITATESCATIDIGGGSTEFVFSVGDRLNSISIPVGAVTLTDSHLHNDPPRPEELTNAIGLVQDYLDDVIHDLGEIETASRIVGLAGTVVTIAAVELGIVGFDSNLIHGFTLTKAAAEDVFRTLATETLADRKFNPGLPPERADVIVGGCCILVAFMRRFTLSEITVSAHNLLDGMIAELRQD